jgi:predicted O-methyltransferase YrrM
MRFRSVTSLVCLLLFATSSSPQPAIAQSVPGSAATPAIEKLLTRIRASDKGQLAISEEDGRFLRVLVGSTGAKRVLEIGAASGYSAIWMGLGLRETGGKLVTIEYDAARAKEAAANVREAGLTDVVQVVAGDAFKEIPKLQGGFDLVFLDAWKPDYKKFFDLVFPRLSPGGLFLAHNVINKKSEMADFLDVIHTSPQVFTTVVSPGHEGISMTYKRR